jgi:DNA repair protein RadA/Sms
VQKTKLVFQCISCGVEYPRWHGKCSECNEWNTVEQKEIQIIKKSKERIGRGERQQPVSVSSYEPVEKIWETSGVKALDQLLGNGFVTGSSVLLGGEPGIGKSTLALQVAQNLSVLGRKVLYISGEESINQIYMRSCRLLNNNENLYLYTENNILEIISTIDEFKPDFVVLDSIQVVYHPEINSVAGSVNQVRYSASELMDKMRKRNITSVIIGHITKDGGLAGPKALEHLVDVILYLEGDRSQEYRLLRSIKNRFSSTDDICVFKMEKEGLLELEDSSELFVDKTTLQNPGSVVTAIVEGTRAYVVEIQALVVDSGYGMAKRTFIGIDANRANLMIATIEKALNIKLSQKDIIINVVGGLKIKKTGVDLGIVMAILSSFYEKPVKKGCAFIGEVGLTGEIRNVSKVEKIIAELSKMGIKTCVVPRSKSVEDKVSSDPIKVEFMMNIKEAVDYL